MAHNKPHSLSRMLQVPANSLSMELADGSQFVVSYNEVDDTIYVNYMPAERKAEDPRHDCRIPVFGFAEILKTIIGERNDSSE